MLDVQVMTVERGWGVDRTWRTKSAGKPAHFRAIDKRVANVKINERRSGLYGFLMITL